MVLSAADIRGVLQGASSLLDVDDPEVLPAAVLEVVDRLVSCDHASYNAIDLAGGRATVLTTGAAPDPEGVRAFAAHAAENPLVAYLHSTGDRAPIRLSDFVTQRQFRRRPIYDLVYRSLGVEHQLAFGVVGQPSEVVGVALNRARGDFTDRDVEVLGLLRPLLEQIWTAIVATRPSTGIRERLTAREREVMRLLARGATNAQIAGVLGISEKTVGKHLEHVYDALGVSNRTAAAARWLSPHM